MAPTVIAHGDICHNLLQDSFSFRVLLVLALCREQLCSKLLDNHRDESTRCENSKRSVTYLNLPPLEEFSILTL